MNEKREVEDSRGGLPVLGIIYAFYLVITAHHTRIPIMLLHWMRGNPLRVVEQTLSWLIDQEPPIQGNSVLGHCLSHHGWIF